jgi:uncharacterized protein
MDPIIYFFLFGIIAGLLKSKLRFPPVTYELLSIMLLLTIGIKGGVELSKQPILLLLPKILGVILIGCILPIIAYPILLRFGKFKKDDAASIAAHYGSVSVGTYAVATAYLTLRQIAFESYMPLFVAILEIPAIAIGIILAKGISKQTCWKELSKEVFLGKSVVLLIGGLLIGLCAGPQGIAPVEGFFFNSFKGILALFMLEMGLICSKQIATLKHYGAFIIMFGLAMPLISSILGVLLGYSLDLSLGGTTLLATMTASASYIAVPAAMRIAVPEANPTLSLSASLGVTLPFNIIFGVTIYHHLSEYIFKLIG